MGKTETYKYYVKFCRIVIEKYVEAVHELYMDMGRKLAKSVGMEGDLLKGWTSQFRVIKYHFTPETLGLPATHTHTDSGFLTILQDDELVEGLEVMNKSTGEFEAVDSWPGTVILILGDVAKVSVCVLQQRYSRTVRNLYSGTNV